MSEDSFYEIIEISSSIPPTPLILLCNPKSGSTLASSYLPLSPIYKCVVGSQEVSVHIFNMSLASSFESACEQALSLSSFTSPLRVFVAGGDGSLIWAIETMASAGVRLEKLLFGILPFGSGNDLAASLGWGRDPPAALLDPYIAQWVAAVPHPFDVWTAAVTVRADGGIGQVLQTKDSFFKQLLQNGPTKQLTLTRLMTNYFSFGLDARIGLGFDKHRTAVKCCNRLRYGWEGLKKMCCCVRTAKVNEMVRRVTGGGRVIFDSESGSGMGEDTAVLLMLNVRTYGGGENYVWEKARAGRERWEKQSMSDQKIEMMTFQGKLSLGLEQVKCTQGQARRVEQGSGPFEIEFEDSQEKCYMQVDGQYFYLERPLRASLNLWEKSADIRVLYKAI
jgi:diacylglycerol kinase (ATP)